MRVRRGIIAVVGIIGVMIVLAMLPAPQPTTPAELFGFDASVQHSAKLTTPVILPPDVKTLGAVVAAIARQTGETIEVDWPTLADVGIDRRTDVTDARSDGSGKEVLQSVLKAAGGELVALGSRFERGVVRVSTMEKLNATLITHTYDLGPLLDGVNRYFDFEAPGLRERLSTASSLPDMWRALWEFSSPAATDVLAQFVINVMDPDWRDGNPVQGSRARLIITETPEHHERASAALFAVWLLVNSGDEADAAPIRWGDVGVYRVDDLLRPAADPSDALDLLRVAITGELKPDYDRAAGYIDPSVVAFGNVLVVSGDASVHARVASMLKARRAAVDRSRTTPEAPHLTPPQPAEVDGGGER